MALVGRGEQIKKYIAPANQNSRMANNIKADNTNTLSCFIL